MRSHAGSLARYGAIAIVALVAAGCAANAPKEHRLVIHVDDNDPARMNLALNNMSNVFEHYRKLNEPIRIEVVAYGPGLHMLRADTSPVRTRIDALRLTYDTATFSACGNTKTNMEKAEKKEVPLLADVRLVEAGVTRIMELQEAGWSYIRP